MKSLKVMGIVGIVMSVLSWIFIASFEYTDPMASIGWGFIAMFYLIALSIVSIVQGTKKRGM